MMHSGSRHRLVWKVSIVIVAILFTFPNRSYGIVSKAVGLSDFEEQDLEDFHDKLLDEERSSQMNLYDDVTKLLVKAEGDDDQTEGEVRDVLKRDIELLKTQLLALPKRDRLRYEITGDYTYDSNINRRPPRAEKGDSVFDAKTTILLDLSGKKTDFRFDVGWKRQWNWVFSEKDEWQAEERLRFRRKYFKKVLVSSNSRIARNNSKTIEIDENKIRWDLDNQMAWNIPFTRKLSVNVDASTQRRIFRNEAFDQDSSRQVTVAPSAFWNITRKSRVQAGYRFSASRIRTKSGDSNSHDFALGYFGQVTRKSSLSFNVAYNRQNPRSLDTAKVRTYTVGTGHIWQMTPKTQLTTQVTRSIQNTTSDLVSGSVDGANMVARTDMSVTTDNVSFSFNSRLLTRLSAVLSLAMTHSRTKGFQGSIAEEVEARQFTFPIDFSFTYAIRRWLTWRAGYSFGFRTGNEKNETSRSHTWDSSVRLIF